MRQIRILDISVSETNNCFTISISETNKYFNVSVSVTKKKVYRYQMDNQNPYIEERQTTQWSKEKEQKDKQ